MKRVTFFLFALLIVTLSFGQNRENANWCFGMNAGVNFNPPQSTFTSQISNGNPGNSTTSASVSDANGQLLFYTDGLNVWNGVTHTIMSNGQGLYGGNVPHAQNVVIVPKPNRPGIYYIFSFSYPKTHGGANPPGRGGFHYSVVDMSQNGGNGAVTIKNININDAFGNAIDYAFTYAGGPNNLSMGTKMTTALSHDQNGNQNGIWLVAFLRFDNTCDNFVTRFACSYRVTENGINGTQDGFSPNPTWSNALDNNNYYVNICFTPGVMKISPDGHWLADAEFHLNLYSFNDQNGAVAYDRRVYEWYSHPGGGANMGVEFSPGSGLIYFSLYGIDEVLQYRISDWQTTTLSLPVPSAMQLAMDGNIYICAAGTSGDLWGYLSVIQDPDIFGTGCGLSAQGISLSPNTHTYALPQWIYHVQTTCNTTIVCDPISLSGCNYSTNGDFAHSPLYNSGDPNHVNGPFGLGLVPNWVETNGSPQIYDNVVFPVTNPPTATPPIAGYAYMFSSGPGFLGSPNVSSDGIGQRIPQVTAGSTYSMTFFKRFIVPAGATPTNMDRFFIVLMHCSDYNLIRTCENNGSPFPAFPPNSQVIYCEQNLSNTAWEQAFVSFRADGNYDFIWIIPRQADNVLFNNGQGISGVDFTGLEIIKTGNYFSAGPAPNPPSPPNCTVTIGPLTPNCGVRGALFEWISPLGTVIPAPANQQIQVDASITGNVGIWTLMMTVPNAIFPPTNFCSQIPNISATVNVPGCTAPSTGPWVWMHEDHTVLQPSVYGNIGQPHPDNRPGYRTGSATWTDLNGNLWLFGGTRPFGNNGQHEEFNDLWKYDADPTSLTYNQWTWVNGDNTPNQTGVYYSQGSPHPNNKPGSRTAAASWVDGSGKLWMFGGGHTTQGFSYFNDLWKYDPDPLSLTYNQWTWVSGNNITNQVGVYGNQGIYALGNKPGGREYAKGWADINGNIWIWGGAGIAYNGSSYTALNDLWEYDMNPQSLTYKQWRWMKGVNGSLFNSQPLASFGFQGFESSTNTPAAHGYPGVSWTDANHNFWLFGGLTYIGGSQLFGFSNALWKFNVSTNKWVWVSGDNIPDQPGVYGTQGIAAPGNKPGARSSLVSWKDPSNNFWLFGGLAIVQYPSGITASDLWKYDVGSGWWTWISGPAVPNTSAVYYGTQGVGSPLTTPGQRLGSVSWSGNDGNFWLFGGLSNDYRNDLWKYTGNCTGPNCRPGSFNRSESIVNKNLQKESIRLQAKGEEKIDVSKISLMEVYNSAGQLIKRINNNVQYYEILNASKISGILPGLYFIRVVKKDNTIKTLTRYLQ